MQLLSFLSAVIVCVILQIPLMTEAALTAKSGLAETTVKGDEVSPIADIGIASQNYSTVTSTQHESRATSANSSESLTSVSSVASTAATIHSDNETTTESGNLTTHGKTSWTTSRFTENGTLTTSNASTSNVSSETVTASFSISDTSTFNSTPPTTEQTKITDSFSTSAMYISSTSINKGTGTRFDAASFLGGIVLALGLCVTIVFGYQCYKNRKSTSPPYSIVDE